MLNSTKVCLLPPHKFGSNYTLFGVQSEDFLPTDFEVSEFRAEYKKSAKLQDKLYPLVLITDAICTIVLADEAHKPYTTVQFIRKGN